MQDLFSVPVFFISFREALEAGIIVSVLLAILNKTFDKRKEAALHKAMVRQVWAGTLSGIGICLVAGAIIIGGLHELADKVFSNAEDVWEGLFSLLASIIITVMGAVFLRVGKLQVTWRAKLLKAMEARHKSEAPASMIDRITNVGNKYALFLLPFITILREGFEGIIFIASVIVGSPASTIPLSAFAGMLIGIALSYLIYRGTGMASIQRCLLLSTGLLYLVAAGLFSKGIWHLEAHRWNRVVGGDAAELGSGPGSYDIRKSVWHVNCCNPDLNGGGIWGILNAVLGWQNSATVSSVVSYNVYWIVVTVGLLFAGHKDKNPRRFTSEAGTQDGSRQPLLTDS